MRLWLAKQYKRSLRREGKRAFRTKATRFALQHLDTYTSKLAPTLAMAAHHAPSDSGYETVASVRSEKELPTRDTIADMHLVKVVASLFKLPDQAVQDEVDNVRTTTVSEKVCCDFWKQFAFLTDSFRLR